MRPFVVVFPLIATLALVHPQLVHGGKKKKDGNGSSSDSSISVCFEDTQRTRTQAAARAAAEAALKEYEVRDRILPK